MRSLQASPVFRYCICKIFTIWCLMTPNDLWSRLKTIGFLYSMWYSIIPNMTTVQASLLEISYLQGFHNLTPVDLWPPPKNIGFLYSMWYTYIPNMRSVRASLLEISCLQGFLQGFHNLTPVDPKWPLTSTKNNRLLLLNVVHLHTKYEICPSFPCWYILFTSWPQMFTRCLQGVYKVFTRFLQGFYKVFTIWPMLTPNDLWPPPKTIGFLYSMWYTYIPNLSDLSELPFLRYRVYKQASRHTHTHTHTHTPSYTHTHAIMNAKVTIIIETKKFEMRAMTVFD